MIKDIRFQDQGQSFHFYEKVKLHTISEIEAYAKEFGFERKMIWGDYLLSDFEINDSPRAINLFIKK